MLMKFDLSDKNVCILRDEMREKMSHIPHIYICIVQDRWRLHLCKKLFCSLFCHPRKNVLFQVSFRSDSVKNWNYYKIGNRLKKKFLHFFFQGFTHQRNMNACILLDVSPKLEPNLYNNLFNTCIIIPSCIVLGCCILSNTYYMGNYNKNSTLQRSCFCQLLFLESNHILIFLKTFLNLEIVRLVSPFFY